MILWIQALIVLLGDETMRRLFLLTTMLSVALLLAGCGGSQDDTGENGKSDASANSDSDGADADGGDSGGGDSGEGGSAAGKDFPLDGANTTIAFVGTHVGDKPDPRKGRFEKLSGNIAVVSGEIAAIHVEIETASLNTEIEKLTNHLKSPDFFDVRQFPKASFKSTSVTQESDGKILVKGDLTLLGTTKSIEFPATAEVDNGQVSLQATFDIDRTDFGMTFGDNVEKTVAMSVTVGQP